MFNDGPEFLALTQAFAVGDWARALGHDYHPLYPFATLVVGLVTGATGDGYVSAAIAVSVLSGTVAVGCLYAFLRSAFGLPAAWIGALALAVHPYAVRFSSDVQSDGLYLALFLAAVALAWAALRGRRPALAGWAGALSGLAYLTRPEGVGVALASGAVAGLAALRGEGKRLCWLGWIAALFGGLALVAAPYLVSLRLQTGTWELTRKKSVARFAGFEAPPPAAEAPEVAPAPGMPAAGAPGPPPGEPDAIRRAGHLGPVSADFLRTLVSGARIEILLLLGLGLFASRGRPGPRAVFVGALVGLYGCVLAALAWRYGYVSHRHVLPPLTLLFGWVGLGVPVAGGALLALAQRLRGAAAAAVPRPRVALALGLALLVLPSLGKGLRPTSETGVAERRAAEWLRAQGLPPGAVAADKSRVAYYAGAPHVSLRAAPDRELVAWLQARGARYLIVGERIGAGPAGRGGSEPRALRGARAAGLPVLHEVEAEGEAARVFAVPPPDGPVEEGR